MHLKSLNHQDESAVNTRIPLEKINYAIYHDPTMIPILMKDCSISKGLLYDRLRRAVPHRIGVEFECLGNVCDQFNKDNNLNLNSNEDFARYFRICDYDADEMHKVKFTTLHNPESDSEQYEVDPDEYRVSIANYSQLAGLYRCLNVFKKYLELPSGGGIHIHVDLSKYLGSENNRKIVAEYLRTHMKDVIAIFPKYTGNYNHRKVGIRKKATYVNVSRLGTLEFRIAPLTFDYEVLIKWIIGCSKLTSQIINKCHLKISDTVVEEVLENDHQGDVLRSLPENDNRWSYRDYVQYDQIIRYASNYGMTSEYSNIHWDAGTW